MLQGLVDFSRLSREIAARFDEIQRKHDVFPSIKMLDAFRYGKINKPSSISSEAKSPCFSTGSLTRIAQLGASQEKSTSPELMTRSWQAIAMANEQRSKR
jgi:hypothetical protein